MIILSSTDKNLALLRKDFLEYGEFAFDTETTEDHFIRATLRGISFYFPNKDNFYLSYEHDKELLDFVRPYLQTQNVLKIGHEIKYDIHILLNHGVELQGPIYDTKIAYWVLNSEDKPFGLKDLAERKLGEKTITYKQVDKKDIQKFGEYGKQDARFTYQLYLLSKQELKKARLLEYYNTFEMEVLRVWVDIERKGVALDIPKLGKLKEQYLQRLEELEKQFVRNMFGNRPARLVVPVTKKGVKGEEEQDFNLGSNNHLRTIFYDIKGYPVTEKTETGQPAVNVEAVKQLVQDGVAELRPLLEYRQIEKLLGTYVEPFLTSHNLSSRIYSFYLQHGTATGRASSKTPNIQNVPVGGEGKRVRQCLIADEGCVFVNADFAQLELRVAAHWSNDPKLIANFHNKEDVIDQVCEYVLGVEKEDQTKEKRTIAKAIVYGSLFGAGPGRLAKEAEVDILVARKFLNKYFSFYKQLKGFQLMYPVSVRNNNCEALSLFGRRRRLPILAKSQISTRYRGYGTLLYQDVGDKELEGKIHHAEREALSMRIQGTAADIMKAAMLRCHKAGLDLRVQVHDELLVSCKDDPKEIERTKKLLTECMVNAVNGLRVPLEVKIKVVRQWGEDTEE